jgi:hypothetical protein
MIAVQWPQHGAASQSAMRAARSNSVSEQKPASAPISARRECAYKRERERNDQQLGVRGTKAPMRNAIDEVTPSRA